MEEYIPVPNLPRTEPVDISFENVSYSVSLQQFKKGAQKQILKSISGEFRSGEMTAVMGPSGAGKSSLLNLLSGFTWSGMQGCMYQNGQSYSENVGILKKKSCYIMQDDFLCPKFTVNETMMIAAHLKLSSSTSEKSKYLLIDNILDGFGLSQCKDTRCDLLSGGQRKRLSIALELIDNPSVMFLDEPTTGLDSLSSLHCLKALKALARNGRTIVCTIHQPSATMFEMFDHIYLLSEGLCIYQGSSRNAVPFFSEVGLSCPQYHSIADHIAEIAAGDYGNFSEKLSIATLDTRWRSPPLPKTAPIDERTSSWPVDESRPPSEFSRLWTLMNRNLLVIYRDWTVTHLKLLAHVLVAIILGLNYQNFGTDGSKTINNIGFAFCCVVYLSYTSMMPAVLRFPEELSVVRKEKFNNWYNLRTYYLAFNATNTPLQLFYVFIFVLISYYLTAQPMEFQRFCMFTAICMLTTLTAESLGLFFGTFGGILYGLCLGSVVIAILVVFSGCLCLYPHMSVYLYVPSFICFGRYAFHGLVLAVYGYDREPLPCPYSEDYCHLRFPSRILEEIGVEDGHFWFNCLTLIGMLLAFRTITFVSLKRKIVYGTNI